MPRAVVISKLNHAARRLRRGARAGARRPSATRCVPLYVPVAAPRPDIDDLVALLSQTVSDYSEYATKGRAVREPDDDEQLLHRRTTAAR